VNIERTWWFKSGVGAFTLISAIALFYFQGQWPIGPRSFSGCLIFLFCLLGLGRMYAGLFGVVAIMLTPPSHGANQKR
jgi:hypothetical protein